MLSEQLVLILSLSALLLAQWYTNAVSRKCRHLIATAIQKYGHGEIAAQTAGSHRDEKRALRGPSWTSANNVATHRAIPASLYHTMCWKATMSPGCRLPEWRNTSLIVLVCQRLRDQTFA